MEVQGAHPYFPGSVEEKVKLLHASAREGQLIVYWDDLADESLAAAVNGEVFRDEEGTFSAIQEFLRTGMPKEVYYLKLTNACARLHRQRSIIFQNGGTKRYGGGCDFLGGGYEAGDENPVLSGGQASPS